MYPHCPAGHARVGNNQPLYTRFWYNVSERAVVPSVIHTKVSGGFRSVWGANTYVALCSVIDTAERHGATSSV
jgi:hypothetical protein